MKKHPSPDVTALLEKGAQNFRIDSAFLRMKCRDALAWDDIRAAQVLSAASGKVARLASSFERLRRDFGGDCEVMQEKENLNF